MVRAEYMTVQKGFTNFPAFLLDPSGVVGANANYLYKYYLKTSSDPGNYSQTDPSKGGPQDNVLTWIEGDLLAGMNVGTVGSDKTSWHSRSRSTATRTKPDTIIGTLRFTGLVEPRQHASHDPSGLRLLLRLPAERFGLLQSLRGDHLSVYRCLWLCLLRPDHRRTRRDLVECPRGQCRRHGRDHHPSRCAIVRSPGTVNAIEYYNAALEHYFFTWRADEIAALDAATVIKGWVRTGRSFKAYATAQPGTTPVCRFYHSAVVGQLALLWARHGRMRATAAQNPAFIMEYSVFMYMFLPNQGACPANTTPIYRVYSNRVNLNHRYVADMATRDQMVARGWLAEGEGADSVLMCAPQ